MVAEKLALVTGASGAIGGAVARLLAARKARVALHCHRRLEEGEALASEIGAACGSADLAEEGQVAALFDEVVSWGGPLQMVIHCAGTLVHGRLSEVSPAQWRRCLEDNLTSAFLVAREAARQGRMAQAGALVLVSSVAGLAGAVAGAPYGAAKAGVIGLARSLAVELAPRLRVNCVAPGPVESPLMEWAGPEVKARLCAETPLGCYATPEQVAEAAVFLASSGASHITGQTLVVDGGRVRH